MPVKNTGSKKTTAAPKKTTQRAGEAITREKNRRHIWSVVLFALGILLIVFSFVGSAEAEVPNLADRIHTVFCGLFGISTFFIGPIVIYVAIMLSANKGKSTVGIKLFQLIFIILLFSAAAQILFIGEIGSGNGFFESVSEVYEQGKMLKGGGVFGMLLGFPLLLFGRVVAGIIIVLIAFVMIMLTANISLMDFLSALSVPFKKLGKYLNKKRELYREDSEYLRAEREKAREEEKLKKAVSKEIDAKVGKDLERAQKFASIEAAVGRKKETDEITQNESEKIPEKKSLEEQIKENHSFHEELDAYIHEEGVKDKAIRPLFDPLPNKNGENVETDLTFEKETPHKKEFDNAVLQAIEDFKKEINDEDAEKAENEKELNDALAPSFSENSVSDKENFDINELKEQYALPPVILLNDVVQEKSSEDIEAELETNSVTLVETLKSFGVQTKIVGVCRGPSVTRYEIQPAAGVMISKITRLVDDIALNLATAGVRIEAPIPNKAAVGIEVPNKKVDTVHFRSLVDSDAFRSTESKLGAVIGMDISGEIILADIAKMPHMLIAGTTGSGKSVCVNSIIMSILFRSTPDEVRLLMIDPKAVEFMIYNGIPHLLIPVVTDPKKAAGALGWAVTEMLNRYKLFAENNVRDINGYNSLVKGNPELTAMPQIVIFIDELADLMMASPGEVEDSICRLAQMARAAGMHLVIATQRPSVNVVTGVIKANIPSRIALKVASQVDSRTIIDSAGAEKLLGKGDMLYFPVGAPKPMRVQGCWVSDKEVERVVDFIKNSFILDYDERVIEEIDRQTELAALNKKSDKKPESGDIDVSDDKLDEAIEAVIEAGQASTSYLQRKLKLGYGRAARLIDIMEEMGVVGSFEGSKPRQVIMTKQEWYEMKMNKV